MESLTSDDDSKLSELTEEEHEVEETESGTESESGSEDEEQTENEGETESEHDAEEADENDPFDQLIQSAREQIDNDIEKGIIAKEDKDAVNKRFKKVFREKYKDALLWIHQLRQNPTHRKIVETAKDLRSDSINFDYEESIEASISKRKHLLNRLVPEYDEDEMDTD